MKAMNLTHKRNQSGSALLMTLIMCGAGLAILAAAMAWSASSARLTHRVIQYNVSVASAEAATEKVLSQMTRDYMYGGESLVIQDLGQYRNTVPTAADSSYWSTWTFDDGNGNVGQTYVQRDASSSGYKALSPIYAGLNGFVSTYTVVSHAQNNASVQQVNAGVYQQLQLTSIPIFQFAMYSSGDMEISCGQPFAINGPVHSNGSLYVEPDNALTFESGVTAVVSNLFAREALDTRPPPSGTVVYLQPQLKLAPVQSLTLPIGASNSPTAIREIIEPPPAGESPGSQLGRLRYYNQCDIVVVATDTGITATSGEFNNFTTLVPTNQLPLFVAVTNSFWDAREGKTVMPIDINVGALTAWSLTNTSLRPVLLGSNVTSLYVEDLRNLPATDLGAVRVYNGLLLPTNGLTVATGRPLYVWGDYNEYNPANLGTTNTATTLPASLVADAITFLSDNWSDANSTAALGSRLAASTTVNAALLTGAVDTSLGNYSGGMENFPRFLENWGLANVSTYNGSMIKMFPSLYATNVWGQANVYKPPTRNWNYDANFNNPTQLPPKTPSLQQVIRNQWAEVTPGQDTPPTVP